MPPRHLTRRAVIGSLGLWPLVAWAGCAGAPSLGDPAAETDPAAGPDVEIILTARSGEANLLPGAPTRVWRFVGELVRGPASTLQSIEGSYLGPVIRLRRGQHVRIRFRNQLGERSIMHWHGLDVPEHADGHPRLAVGDGEEYVYEFEVANRAGTYFYHPHPHMRTAAQVYQGLAGLLIIADAEEEALQLPAGSAELLCVLQDRRFDGDNQLVYADTATSDGMRGGMGRGMGRGMGGGMAQMMDTMNGWLGDRLLVSGRVQPTMTVDRRSYRVRLLNGSNARFYRLAWSDRSPIIVIGGDGGLLEQPRTPPDLVLAPGQRADLLLDLSQHAPGTDVRLESLAFPAADVGRMGMMMGETSPVPQGAALRLMTLHVSATEGPRYQVPERISIDEFRPMPSAPVRQIPLTFMMNWFLDGRLFDMTDVSDAETVAPGSTHIWEFVNRPNPMGMAMAHPMHLHGRQFRVISRTGGPPNALREGIIDEGWKDTVVVLPGETVRVQVTFSSHPGLYLYHCHILEHEDMGMMRNFRIRAE